MFRWDDENKKLIPSTDFIAHPDILYIANILLPILSFYSGMPTRDIVEEERAPRKIQMLHNMYFGLLSKYCPRTQYSILGKTLNKAEAYVGHRLQTFSFNENTNAEILGEYRSLLRKIKLAFEKEYNKKRDDEHKETAFRDAVKDTTPVVLPLIEPEMSTESSTEKPSVLYLQYFNVMPVDDFAEFLFEATRKYFSVTKELLLFKKNSDNNEDRIRHVRSMYLALFSSVYGHAVPLSTLGGYLNCHDVPWLERYLEAHKIFMEKHKEYEFGFNRLCEEFTALLVSVYGIPHSVEFLSFPKVKTA